MRLGKPARAQSTPRHAEDHSPVKEPATSSLGPALSLENVTFAYDSEPILEDITLQLPRGQFMALVGPNGGGKTTLLKVALGLLQPPQGHVLLFGQEVARFHQWHRISYVPQRPSGFESLSPATVLEVVAQGAYKGPDPLAFLRPQATREVLWAMKTMGLKDLSQERIAELSIGQQRRAILARALVKRPEALFLDEPAAGLDPAAQEALFLHLSQLHKEHGVTILLVSHDLAMVTRYTTVMACIRRKIIHMGPPQTLHQEHIAALFGLDHGPVDHL
ncbi:MAG: metal ABC transporter ATP-binding protein [Chloroflexi bacterium]|nr:metal ABC transporter ATP-binding protein [Chloroflexota bacterium]